MDKGLHRGERLYAALEALGGLKEYFCEMLTSWEPSPERQAEYPTRSAVLDEYPDQASIDVRLAHESLEMAREWPSSDDLDGAVVLVRRAHSASETL